MNLNLSLTLLDVKLVLQQAVKEATLEEVSEEMLMEDVDTKQILANHKIPEGLKIVNIEKLIVKVETPKTKLPEPKPSLTFKDCRSFPHLSEVWSSFHVKSTLRSGQGAAGAEWDTYEPHQV